MPRHAFLTISALLCVGKVWALDAQIEQARQFRGLGEGIAPAFEMAGTSAFEETAGRDRDSFGVQQMLRDEEKLRPFRTFADISAFVTNNVALTRRDALTDSFLLATFGFDYRRPLPHGLQIEANLRAATFRYNEFRQLDFNSVDAGLGVAYHTEKLGGVDFFLRYNFNVLIGVETEETFFKNHTISLGVQKAVAFSQAHYAFFGVAGQIGFADPKISERSELSAYAGYHLQATRHLEVDLLYRYGYYLYSEGERRDQNQTISLGLRYSFTKWLSVSASTFVGWNRSNREVFDYDAANAGGGLTLSWVF